MTPQPSALAALQRYDCEYKSGSWDMRRNDNGDYVLFDAVEAAWPTQAQGEAVAWQYRFRDGLTRGWSAWRNCDNTWAAQANQFPDHEARALYTHPSPSTAADDPNTCVLCKCRLPDAALREALNRTQRRVVCAAIRLDDKLVVGPRHWDGVMHSQCDTATRIANHDKHEKEEQGFIDQHGVFMDRREAWKVADAAGQILFRCGGDGERLFSENLY